MPRIKTQRDELRRKTYEVLWSPHIKAVLRRLPFIRRIYNGWARQHPFDVVHGLDTSGLVDAADCAPNTAMAAHISPYGGSQPSIVRAGLALLPDHDQYAFVDLGCGKGRPLVVASELAFCRVMGVEINPKLASVAQRNATVIAMRYPRRTSIEVHVGDATAVSAPAPYVVYFTYHPFDRSLVSALVRNIENMIARDLRHAFFVYYNPVHGDVLDQSALFSRWCAEVVPYAPEELGYGPDLSDTLVVWQTVPERYVGRPGAQRRIMACESGGGNARLVYDEGLPQTESTSITA